MEYLFSSEAFAYLAFLATVLGLLARDEILLRLMILIGNGFYLAYYYIAPTEPLMGAIITNGALAAANVVMIIVVARERTTFSMAGETMAIYAHFTKLSPGQFRRLYRLAREITVSDETELTQVDRPVDQLFYVLDGGVTISKGDKAADIPGSMFVGEIAYLTGEAASASVTARPHTRYLAWDHADLVRMARRTPAIENALMAHLNLDMARKVSASLPVEP